MTSCLRTGALVVGLCRIVKRHRLSFLNLALAVCWTRPQFTRNVRTDLIPAQSGSLFHSHIDDPPQEWAGFELEIITQFLEETNPRPPSSKPSALSSSPRNPTFLYSIFPTLVMLICVFFLFITFQVIINFWSNSDPLCLLG